MDSTVWLIVAILGGAIFVYALVSLILRWRRGDVNYKNLYTVGLSLLPLGIIFVTENKVFGGIYFITSLLLIGIGLKNKDKWQDAVLTPEQRKRQKVMLIIGVVILSFGVLFGIFAYLRY